MGSGVMGSWVMGHGSWVMGQGSGVRVWGQGSGVMGLGSESMGWWTPHTIGTPMGSFRGIPIFKYTYSDTRNRFKIAPGPGELKKYKFFLKNL